MEEKEADSLILVFFSTISCATAKSAAIMALAKRFLCLLNAVLLACLPTKKIKVVRRTLLKSPARSSISALLYKGTQGYKYFLDNKYGWVFLKFISHAHLKAHTPVLAIRVATKLLQNNFW